MAGYPIITGAPFIVCLRSLTNSLFSFVCSLSVPLGFQPDNVIPTAANPTISNAPGVPFGLSFTGTAFSEFKLISYAYAYEQATHTRLNRLAFKEAIPKTQLKDIINK